MYLVNLDEDKFILMIVDKVGNGALPGVEHLGNQIRPVWPGVVELTQVTRAIPPPH